MGKNHPEQDATTFHDKAYYHKTQLLQARCMNYNKWRHRRIIDPSDNGEKWPHLMTIIVRKMPQKQVQ